MSIAEHCLTYVHLDSSDMNVCGVMEKKGRKKMSLNQKIPKSTLIIMVLWSGMVIAHVNAAMGLRRLRCFLSLSRTRSCTLDLVGGILWCGHVCVEY